MNKHAANKTNKIKTLKATDNITLEERCQFIKFKLGFELLKNFINNHLFGGAVITKLLHKILDSDAKKLKIPKRSAAVKLLGKF